MGNQQPSVYDKGLWRLAINAKFGDGSLWKHPESRFHKLIYTSTTPELLECKLNICPDIFKTGVRKASVGKGNGRFANAKQLYRLSSITNPLFSEIKEASKEDLFDYLTIEDFALWYLDDGSFIQRKDYKKTGGSFRYYLCIGDTCNTEEKEQKFIQTLQRVFEKEKVGRISLNGSKATVNNKTWQIPVPIAKQIIEVAKTFLPSFYKYPCYDEGSTTIRNGVGD